MSISLRQTLAQLASHTHTYETPEFSGEASYQSFLSYPSEYSNMLVPFNDPSRSGGGSFQTGPPDYPSGSSTKAEG